MEILILLALAVGFLFGLAACHMEYKQRKRLQLEKAMKESFDQEDLPIFLKKQAD